MTRQIGLSGMVLGLMALVACDGHSQTPIPLGPSVTSAPIAASNPIPPGNNPSGNPLVGTYTLTLNLGSGCAVIPEAERTRRYTATIDSSDSGGSAAGKRDRSLIEASGTNTVWYCPTPSNYPFPCFSFLSCRSTDMRLTLTRK